MTKEEAIKRFETLLLHVDTDCVMGMETTEAINMAIKALEQPEPCEDAVSRKAAIDGLNDAVHEHNITDFDAVATILALPSVTPKQRWIPVTERLPEEDGRYLVCGAKGGIYHANYRGRWWTQVGCGGKLVPSVVAWMPLPKPWEGEAE